MNEAVTKTTNGIQTECPVTPLTTTISKHIWNYHFTVKGMQSIQSKSLINGIAFLIPVITGQYLRPEEWAQEKLNDPIAAR